MKTPYEKAELKQTLSRTGSRNFFIMKEIININPDSTIDKQLAAKQLCHFQL